MKKHRFMVALIAACLALALVSASGCKKKKEALEPDMTGGAPEETLSEGLPTPDLENLNWVPATDMGLNTVYFDYDSSALRPDALATLAANADIMKQNAGTFFQIAGHCDERGTQEYNLALGERRALAVRQHLIQLGVSGDRIVTISYGEEMPALDGHDESAWRLNRRAEFMKGVPKN